MLNQRLYYQFKPFLPWRVRMAMRRIVAGPLRRKSRGDWPIDESAARQPEGWPGWPDGQKFALVLTHDVEGPEGLEKVQQLAELEMSLGFRSSFNLIPEGPYTVPPGLRAWLTERGFEVGVHDLHHDGKLFLSREGFARQAGRINWYLREWGAAGFRSGFMLRNLDWIHDLDVRYDLSTFDTDPFEFQPDGTGTIFPYWVPAPEARPNEVGRVIPNASSDQAGRVIPNASFSEVGRDIPNAPSDSGTTNTPFPLPPPGRGVSSAPVAKEGYLELPYTLPQDSTLFLLFREKSPEIWLRKLDWVADHGGMALVNVHPDYIRFDGEKASARTYPVDMYRRFLEHVRTAHVGEYWHSTARELAAFALTLRPRLRPKPRRICMVTYSHYLSDARVRRYAETLAERGDHVDVVALRSSPNGQIEERVSNVNLHFLQSRLSKNEQSRMSFLMPVLRFLASSSIWIARQHSRHRYDLLHIHNVPDFLVFAAWYPKLTGARVILDIHDIVPEFYASKFKTGDGSKVVSVLKWIERRSARFADHVIISNHLWYEKYVVRTGTQGRCTVFINNVDSRIFRRQPRTRDDDRIIIIFPGGLQWHQGLDIALQAFKRVRQELPNAEFHIYGDGNMKPDLVALADELGLDGSVRFFDPVRVSIIAGIMANADLGVVPKRADSFGNEAYSTKIMEFMSLGVPAVVSSTRIDRYYFDDSVVRFFDSGNSEALAEGMLEILRDPERRRQMVTNALAYAERNSWETRKGDYLQLIDSLCEKG
jgi:glycosyltransferase involved in cell wall biosynthesis